MFFAVSASGTAVATSNTAVYTRSLPQHLSAIKSEHEHRCTVVAPPSFALCLIDRGRGAGAGGQETRRRRPQRRSSKLLLGACSSSSSIDLHASMTEHKVLSYVVAFLLFALLWHATPSSKQGEVRGLGPIPRKLVVSLIEPDA